MSESGAARIESALRSASAQPALVPFLTAGFPDRDRFLDALEQVTAIADVCEIGIPFSDPMADGVTIQRTSQVALEQGTSLRATLDWLEQNRDRVHCPVVLMSYLNPLLRFGAANLATAAVSAGVCGFIIPDLPVDEDATFRSTLTAAGLATVQLVTPLTDPARRKQLIDASTGFLYAVTRAGTTGAAVDLAPVTGFLDALRAESKVPVCAGFGIREARQLDQLRGHADGVIIGSALMEVVERGEDPAGWLRALRSE